MQMSQNLPSDPWESEPIERNQKSELQVELQQIITERKKFGDILEDQSLNKSDSDKIKTLQDDFLALTYPANEAFVAWLLDWMSDYVVEGPLSNRVMASLYSLVESVAEFDGPKESDPSKTPMSTDGAP